MSEPKSALDGRAGGGFVTVTEAGLRGMITLRAELSEATLTATVRKVFGTAMPGQGEIIGGGDRVAAWMAPDELLLMLPHGEAADMARKLDRALKGHHRLVADVSDARAVFRLEGAEGQVREVLAKLTPADVAPAALPVGRIRRSRLAQTAAAFWMTGDGAAEVVCFRSSARYMFDLLCNAARDGAEVGYFTEKKGDRG